MVPGLVNLKWRLLLAGAAVAGVLPARAQGPIGGGQPILFSYPGGGATNASPPITQPQGLPGFVNAIQVPAATFPPAPQIGPLPPPGAPPLSPAAAAQLQRQLDEMKNWTLLTPQEILGLTTPEKIMGIADRDAAGQLQGKTVAMRYLERQEQQAGARTNALAADLSPARWNLPDNQPWQWNPAPFARTNGNPGNAPVANFLPNGLQVNFGVLPGQNQDAVWPKSFSPPPPPAPTPEQLAAAQEFQKLLEPHEPPPGAARFQPGRTGFSKPGTLPIQPAADPIGISFEPVKSSISLPVGVTPLPRLFQSNTLSAPIVPPWKPQPPPWMSSAPQPGVIPQRKF